MTDKQPEALRLAELLDGAVYEIPADSRGWSDDETGDHLPNNCIRDAATELRRLFEENEATQVDSRHLYERIDQLRLVNEQLLEALLDYIQYGGSNKARAAIAAAKEQA